MTKEERAKAPFCWMEGLCEDPPCQCPFLCIPGERCQNCDHIHLKKSKKAKPKSSQGDKPR